ncbi:hypothetical protein B0T22DRAFT_66287 [Podospora appendiculata]|uniref:GRF-type domain-containing protein n=1 Tax=Podospora appendiculata TaxID=314037 RepID=A0AAE1CH82_9PEZI|nr:hypothetical protein B0T22DRAFT_66287 [Podospora appendiculata]
MVFATPSRRPPYQSKAGVPWPPSSKPRPEGTFENGGWFCDCDPPMPAVHLQTKKAGANKGRWFFTCQQQCGAQCGFFLWEDAAQAREKEALVGGGGGKSDVVGTIGRAPAPLPELTPTPIPRQRQRIFRGVPPTTPSKAHRGGGLFVNDDDDDGGGDESDAWEATPPSSGADKRKRIKLEEWDDGDRAGTQAQKKRRAADDEFEDLGSEEERQLARIADQTHDRPRDSLNSSTPSVQGSYEVVDGMTTPVSVRTSLPVTHPKPTARGGEMVVGLGPTPTPVRSRDALGNQQHQQHQQQGDGEGDYPITSEVMRLLAGQPDSTRQAVRDRLNTYALRMLGVERGREMARTALKAKDGRISELQARVESLENERKVSREMMKKLLE